MSAYSHEVQSQERLIMGRSIWLGLGCAALFDVALCIITAIVTAALWRR